MFAISQCTMRSVNFLFESWFCVTMWWLICLWWIWQCPTYMTHKSCLFYLLNLWLMPSLYYYQDFIWLMLKLLHNSDWITSCKISLLFQPESLHKKYVFNPIRFYHAQTKKTTILTFLQLLRCSHIKQLIAIWCSTFHLYDDDCRNSFRNNVSMWKKCYGKKIRTATKRHKA